MLSSRTILVIFLLSVSLCSEQLSAAEIKVSANQNLQEILDMSQNGDVITLGAGAFQGNFLIKQQITLRGVSDSSGAKLSVINAQGIGHALTINNSHVTIENLIVTNWGTNVGKQEAGIYAHNPSDDGSSLSQINITNNKLIGNSFGIWLNHADQATLRNNSIQGILQNKGLALNGAYKGNGIQLEKVTNSLCVDNEISAVRDGIYVSESNSNIIKSNTLHNLRYGIHYMYSYDDIVQNNKVYQAKGGYALMSSSNLTVKNNIVSKSADYGILLTVVTQSTIHHNIIENIWAKPESQKVGRTGKGFFIYNSTDNIITQNLVNHAEIGIYLSAGSENINIYGNSFINNPVQVKYVAHKKQEWSHNGQGNYWSSYHGWDMDNNGIGDTVFEPNDGIDKLAWQYPEMKVLMDSPAIIILRWVQSQYPLFKPLGIKDSYPLMTAPDIRRLTKNNNLVNTAASTISLDPFRQSASKKELQ